MRNKSGNFVVTRQCQYYSGESTVEVASGGLDYAGSDALVEKYPGEFQCYDDPREAVEAAISICKLWRKDGERKAHVATGSTSGMGLEIEPTTFRDARKWAKQKYESLPKCDHCGDILPAEYYTLQEYDGGDSKFCREYCAEKALEFYIESETP